MGYIKTSKQRAHLKSLAMGLDPIFQVGKASLKGVNTKCKIKVPQKQLKAYTKLFKKGGAASTFKVTK